MTLVATVNVGNDDVGVAVAGYVSFLLLLMVLYDDLKNTKNTYMH